MLLLSFVSMLIASTCYDDGMWYPGKYEKCGDDGKWYPGKYEKCGDDGKWYPGKYEKCGDDGKWYPGKYDKHCDNRKWYPERCEVYVKPGVCERKYWAPENKCNNDGVDNCKVVDKCYYVKTKPSIHVKNIHVNQKTQCATTCNPCVKKGYCPVVPKQEILSTKLGRDCRVYPECCNVSGKQPRRKCDY